MADRRDEILRKEVPADCIWEDSRHLVNTPFEHVFNAMDEYAKEWKNKYKEANQFICDIGKLVGLDGLGYDDIKASIEDFRDSIDEKKKEMCLEFMKYTFEKMGGHSVDAAGNVEVKFNGEWITPEQLFENFL